MPKSAATAACCFTATETHDVPESTVNHPTNIEAEAVAIEKYRQRLRQNMVRGCNGRSFASADFADGILQLASGGSEDTEKIKAKR